ncbi:MAG: hypothetical protein ABIG20_03510 [archaeon]
MNYKIILNYLRAFVAFIEKENLEDKFTFEVSISLKKPKLNRYNLPSGYSVYDDSNKRGNIVYLPADGRTLIRLVKNLLHIGMAPVILLKGKQGVFCEEWEVCFWDSNTACDALNCGPPATPLPTMPKGCTPDKWGLCKKLSSKHRELCALYH